MARYDPRTALVVVDVQNDFADPAGSLFVKDGARVTLVLDAGTYKLIDIEGKNLFIPSEGPSPSRQ